MSPVIVKYLITNNQVCGVYAHDEHISKIKKLCKATTVEFIQPYHNVIFFFDFKIDEDHDRKDKMENYSRVFENICLFDVHLPFINNIISLPNKKLRYKKSFHFLLNKESYSRLVLFPENVKIENNCIIIEENCNIWPIFVLVNIRGGSCQGVNFARAFRAFLNPIQVWDIPVYSIE
ncbi:hypothetical protein MXB_2084, partial [Myxobolus squamalis]